MSEKPEVSEQVNPRERAQRARQHVRAMRPHMDAIQLETRKKLVKLYRMSPGSWPDGIDSNKDDGEHWYRGHETEWLDDGTYVGPPVNSPEPVNTNLVNKSAVNTEPVNTSSEAMDSDEKRREYRRQWMADKRAAEKPLGK